MIEGIHVLIRNIIFDIFILDSTKGIFWLTIIILIGIAVSNCNWPGYVLFGIYYVMTHYLSYRILEFWNK